MWPEHQDLVSHLRFGVSWLCLIHKKMGFQCAISDGFGWPVYLQSLAVGQGETLTSGCFRFGLSVLKTGFYVQFCNCSAVQLQENHFPRDHVPVLL